jgi:hypothetical protein
LGLERWAEWQKFAKKPKLGLENGEGLRENDEEVIRVQELKPDNWDLRVGGRGHCGMAEIS